MKMKRDMAQDTGMKLQGMGYSPPMGIPDEHVRRTKGPRRNSCEARPGLIESSHIAPFDEELMEDDKVGCLVFVGLRVGVAASK